MFINGDWNRSYSLVDTKVGGQKSFGGAMQVGDLVRTKEFYLPTRPLGLIIR